MLDPDSAPRSPTRVWVQGIRLGWKSFPRLIALTTVLAFISLLPTIYMAGKVGNAEITPDFILQLFRQGHFVGDLLLLELLMLVLSSFVDALVIRRLDCATHGTPPEHELGFAARKLLPLVVSGILFGITVIIGLFIAGIIGTILGVVMGAMLGHGAALFITPACVCIALIYIGVNLLFFQFAIVLDDAGPVGALNRSCALVFRNWWRAFLVLLITFIVIMAIAVLSMLVTAPFTHQLLLHGAKDTGHTILMKGVLQFVGAAILMPFVVGILYALYQDFKARYARKSAPTGMIQA